MSKPTFCLLSNNSFVLIMFILSLVTLLTPITANTFKTQNTSSTILKITSLPWQDIEKEITSLPLMSDYSLAASNAHFSKEEKQLETLNALSWILDQKNTSYSLQLLSVSRKENLVKFCKEHNICDRSAFYTTEVKGKKLVRLIYGSYPSHKAAKLAKADLTTRLNGISPWARSFKQIKNEL